MKCFNAVRYFAKASIDEFVYFPTFCHGKSSMVLFTHVFFYNGLNISLTCRHSDYLTYMGLVIVDLFSKVVPKSTPAESGVPLSTV